MTKHSFFLLVDACDGRIRIRTNNLQIRMQIQEAQKHIDPEHWKKPDTAAMTLRKHHSAAPTDIDDIRTFPVC